MKILHMVNTYAPVGGIETYVIDLLPLLAKRGHENMLIYRQAHPRTPKTAGQKIYYVPITTDHAHDTQAIRSLIQQERPDVVYLHDIYDPQLALMVSQLVPTAGYIHIFYPVCPGLGKLHHRTDTVCRRAYGLGCIPNIYFNRCASARRPSNVLKIMQNTQLHINTLRHLPRVIVASGYMRDLMVQNGVAPDKIEVLPYFISLPDAPAPRQNTACKPSIMFAGRLEYEKGIPYLMEALYHMHSNHRLIVAGDGSRYEEYVQLARSLGLSERVQFQKWLDADELAAHYRSSAVTVMPTIMPEPFGKVGVEAMANGRPVVAFDVGGISDWLKDGYNGFLVPALDSKQLATRIQQLVDDPALGERLGANGRRYVEENYSAKEHIDHLVALLQKTVAQGS